MGYVFSSVIRDLACSGVMITSSLHMREMSGLSYQNIRLDRNDTALDNADMSLLIWPPISGV